MGIWQETGLLGGRFRIRDRHGHRIWITDSRAKNLRQTQKHKDAQTLKLTLSLTLRQLWGQQRLRLHGLSPIKAEAASAPSRLRLPQPHHGGGPEATEACTSWLRLPQPHHGQAAHQQPETAFPSLLLSIICRHGEEFHIKAWLHHS